MKYYIHTANGGRFYYGHEIADVTIEDVAHQLAHVNRFCGATKYAYSVAQHSVLVENIVAAWVDDRNIRLYALLHDAHEGYMSDIPTPFAKWFAQEFCLGVDLLESAKARLDDMILPRLGVKFPLSREARGLLQVADKLAFVIEARQLFLDAPTWLDEYIAANDLGNLAHIDFRINHMLASEARMAYLSRWKELTDGENDNDEEDHRQAANG